MKYNINQLYLALLMTLLVGCTKEERERPKEETLNIRFSANALEYAKLTEGNYLIYKDSATSLTDSVVVTTSIIEGHLLPRQVINYFTIPAKNVQSFHLILSKNTGTSETEWFNGYALANESVSTDTAAVDMREEDNTPAFFANHSFTSNYSITIEGKNYTNVVVTINDNGLEITHPAYKYTVYYWAKNIGIIKRTTITTNGVNKTYTLVRNN